VYRDEDNGNLIYITQTGSIAVVPAQLSRPQGRTRDGVRSMKPTWMKGLDLKARKGREEDFAKATLYGAEVFRDESNGNLIFLTQTGSLAVVPAKLSDLKPNVEKPQWVEAFVRKVDKKSKDHAATAKVCGIEVFQLPKSRMIIYLTETGSLAVLPAKLSDLR
jgi:hypothetical protein